MGVLWGFYRCCVQNDTLCLHLATFRFGWGKRGGSVEVLLRFCQVPVLALCGTGFGTVEVLLEVLSRPCVGPVRATSQVCEGSVGGLIPVLWGVNTSWN